MSQEDVHGNIETQKWQQRFDVAVLRNQTLTAGDGTRLVADIYLPVRDNDSLPVSWPTLLERTPYGRSLERLVAYGYLVARQGYAYVVQDVRGRGDSEGNFHMMMNHPDEGMDGSETMAWVHSQDWCDGRIGTVGGSFSAANQQAAALHGPQGLKAQMLRDCGTNYYRRMFREHGAFNVGVALPWLATWALEGQEARGDESVRSALIDFRDNPTTWAGRLPLHRGEMPFTLAPSYEDIYFTMLETTDDVEYWHNPTIRLEGRWDEYPKDVAVLMLSGWYAHHSIANFDKLRELGQRLDAPVKLVVGPWIHGPGMLEITNAGDVEFGEQAGIFGPVADYGLRWFDRFVKGVENNVEDDPNLRYFLMGTGDGHRTDDGLLFHGGEWRESPVWPLKDTISVKFYLTSRGSLTRAVPAIDETPSRYDFDPENPCPAVGSTNLQSTVTPEFVLEGPQDQRCRPEMSACMGSDAPIRDRPDVLSFQTEPLMQDLEVTGPLSVHLWISSSARDTDYSGRLVDVYPPSEDYQNGYSLLISDGIQRMRYRDDRPIAELLEPETVYAFVMEMSPTSNLFKAGHCIRLDITSSAFPQYDVNPNTGEALGQHTHTEVAHQVVYHDADRASYIELPTQA